MKKTMIILEKAYEVFDEGLLILKIEQWIIYLIYYVFLLKDVIFIVP